MHLRCEELQTWCNSDSGMEHCRAIMDRIDAGIPRCASLFNKNRVCVGYVLGFDLRSANNSNPIVSGMNVIIDYGEDSPLTARFPVHLLPDALQLSQNNPTMHNVDGSSVTSLFDHADLLFSLSLLGEYFQNNQTLFRFSLEASSCYGDELPLLEVTGISLAAAEPLSRLHLTR